MTNAYVEAATAVVNTVGGVIKILEENRPSVDSNTLMATAMPRDADPMAAPARGRNHISKWYLQRWNFAGETYYSQCKVHIAWAWGARYEGGGAFIPSVYAWVDEINVPEMWVPWSHDLDISFEAKQPYTMDAGDGQIYACLPVEVQLTESTPIDTANDAWQFELYGTGHFVEQ